MAEPSLSSPPAAQHPQSHLDYKPLSPVAVAAIVVAVIFAVLFLTLGGWSFWKRKPLLYNWMLGLALLGIALAVAARIHIRRSEGTRDGLRLANTAWWLSVLFGVMYGGSILASRLAINRQSADVAIAWFDKVKDAEHHDPKVAKEQFYAAFWQTIDPGRRTGIPPSEDRSLESEFGVDQLPKFRSSHLVRLFRRNAKDDVVVNPLGMAGWEEIATGYRVEQVFEIRCPEGIYRSTIILNASEGKDFVGRQWQVLLGDAGLTSRNTTTYGRAVNELLMEGFNEGAKWASLVTAHQHELAYQLTLPVSQRANPHLRGLIFGGVAMGAGPGMYSLSAESRQAMQKKFQVAGWGGGCVAATAISGDVVWDELRSRNFFRAKDKSVLEGADVGKYRAIWGAGAINPMQEGTPLPEQAPLIRITPTEVVVRVPLPVRLPGPQPNLTYGMLTVSSTNPELLKALQEAYEAGKKDPTQNDVSPTLDLLKHPRDWQITSIETKMTPLPTPQGPAMPGSPSGPGGPGPRAPKQGS